MKRLVKITFLTLLMILSFNGFTQKMELGTDKINLHLNMYESKPSFGQNSPIFGTITTPYLYANNLKMNPLISPPLTIVPYYFDNPNKRLIFVIGLKINIPTINPKRLKK